MTEPAEDIPFIWLDDEEYHKALGQLRMVIANYLSAFDGYGLGQYITPVTEAILDAVNNFGMRIRGDDRPIVANHRIIPRPFD